MNDNDLKYENYCYDKYFATLKKILFNLVNFHNT